MLLVAEGLGSSTIELTRLANGSTNSGVALLVDGTLEK